MPRTGETSVAAYGFPLARRLRSAVMGSKEFHSIGPERSRACRIPMRSLFILLAVLTLLAAVADPLHAASFRQGVSAFNRQDYVAASRIFIPLAERGSAVAQSYLG